MLVRPANAEDKTFALEALKFACCKGFLLPQPTERLRETSPRLSWSRSVQRLSALAANREATRNATIDVDLKDSFDQLAIDPFTFEISNNMMSSS